jgi:cystathionine beta-lyase
MVFGKSNLLPFWVADTDFKVMPQLVEALAKRAEIGLFPYETKSPGLKELISAWYKKQYNINIHHKRLLFTPSVNTSVALITELFVKPGEGIIIQPPVYQAFAQTIKSLGREVIENPLVYTEEGYTIDFADLAEKAASPAAKVFLLCHPHNPVGRVWREDELRKLAEICHQNNVFIVTDEIHGDIVYSSNKYIGMVDVAGQFSNKVIMITSAGKSFGIPGLLDSLIYTPNTEFYKLLRNKIESLHIDKGNAFSSAAWECIYAHGEEWLQEFRNYLAGNIEAVDKYLRENCPTVSFIKPEGTYQLWLDFRKLGLSNEELSRFLVDEAGLALNAGHTYGTGGDGFMRMNFASPRPMLMKGMEQLAEALDS